MFAPLGREFDRPLKPQDVPRLVSLSDVDLDLARPVGPGDECQCVKLPLVQLRSPGCTS